MYSFFCLLLFVSSVLGKCRYTNIVSYKKDVNVGDPCQNSGDFFVPERMIKVIIIVMA